MICIRRDVDWPSIIRQQIQPTSSSQLVNRTLFSHNFCSFYRFLREICFNSLRGYRTLQTWNAKESKHKRTKSLIFLVRDCYTALETLLYLTKYTDFGCIPCKFDCYRQCFVNTFNSNNQTIPHFNMNLTICGYGQLKSKARSFQHVHSWSIICDLIH